MVRFNGNNTQSDGMTLERMVELFGYDKTRIAVELNGQIVPKSKLGSTVVKDGDVVEAVSFVGGG